MSCTEESGFPMILRAALSVFPKAQTKDIEVAGSASHLAEFIPPTKHNKQTSSSSPISLHYYSFKIIQGTKFRKIFKKRGKSTMNNDDSGSKNRWTMGLHLKGRKERDNEDLHLFRELHKRDKERTACLLLPVDDLEHSNSGNSPFYRIQSIKKESGFELLSESSKNDYDWLKTPPATPLFPSLEMEAIATAPRMNAQKETPLVQPLSRLQASSNSEATKRNPGMENGMEKSPTTKPRPITPSHRPRTTSSIEPKSTKRTTTPSQRITQASSTDSTIKRNGNNIKSINLKESNTNYLTSNLAKGSTSTAKPNPNPNPNPNPRSRATSPIVRSTIASQIPEFSNETPPNLRTDRSNSVTRGRQTGVEQKSETINSRRQSCSPSSATRGRKEEINRGGKLRDDERRRESKNILGSRMVERMMNARKGNGNDQRDLKGRGGSGVVGDLGFMAKINSADKPLRQLVNLNQIVAQLVRSSGRGQEFSNNNCDNIK